MLQVQFCLCSVLYLLHVYSQDYGGICERGGGSLMQPLSLNHGPSSPPVPRLCSTQSRLLSSPLITYPHPVSYPPLLPHLLSSLVWAKRIVSYSGRVSMNDQYYENCHTAFTEDYWKGLSFSIPLWGLRRVCIVLSCMSKWWVHLWPEPFFYRTGLLLNCS